MGSPVASVLFREGSAEEHHAALIELIGKVADYSSDKLPTPDAFWVCDTRLIGGSYFGDGRPFAVVAGLQADWESDHLIQVANEFGFTPADELAFVALCNSDNDHSILGELCVRLAEQFTGIVSFGGALWPPIPADAGIDFLSANWRQVDPYFRHMVDGMPGKAVGLGYETQPGREWVVHVADAAFTRAWLNHPSFRMVK